MRDEKGAESGQDTRGKEDVAVARVDGEIAQRRRQLHEQVAAVLRAIARRARLGGGGGQGSRRVGEAAQQGDQSGQDAQLDQRVRLGRWCGARSVNPRPQSQPKAAMAV